MNKVLEVYTELDSLFDSKRAMIQHLMVPELIDNEGLKQKADTLWDLHIAKNYKERRLDTFDFPNFGINREKFDALYDKRHLGHWSVYYPTPLIRKIVKLIVELEGIANKPLEVSSMNIVVNTFPYILDDELQDELVNQLQTALKGLGRVKLTHTDPAKHDANYYSRYNYVFKYDLLSSKDSKLFSETVAQRPIPDVTFIIPDILLNDTGEFKGPVVDIIFAMSMPLIATLKLVPVSHDVYDYNPV